MSFKLEEEVLEALDSLMWKLRKPSRTELLKEAVMDLLRKYGVEVKPRPRPRKPVLPKRIRLVVIDAHSVQVR